MIALRAGCKNTPTALRMGPGKITGKYLSSTQWSLTTPGKYSFSRHLDLRFFDSRSRAFCVLTAPTVPYRYQGRRGSPRGWGGVERPPRKELGTLKEGSLPPFKTSS